MIAFIYKLKTGFKALQLARIYLPVQGSDDDLGNSSSHGISTEALLNTTLDKIKAMNSQDHPFLAWAIGPTTIQIVCSKIHVAKLFKLFFNDQKSLNIHITNIKSHVILTPMDIQDLRDLFSQSILSALTTQKNHHQWFALNNNISILHLLGTHIMSLPREIQGIPQNAHSLTIKVEISYPDTLILLIEASVVRFRHAITLSSLNSDDQQHQLPLKGTLCRILPHLAYGIIDTVRIPSQEEIQSMHSMWAHMGYPLSSITSPSSPPSSSPPSSSSPPPSSRNDLYVVDIRCIDDEDAPTHPFPSCAILSSLGLDPIHTSLEDQEVHDVLSRLHLDLTAMYQHQDKNDPILDLWNIPENFLFIKARLWNPHAAMDALPSSLSSPIETTTPAKHSFLTFTSAKNMLLSDAISHHHEDIYKQSSSPLLVLGDDVDIHFFAAVHSNIPLSTADAENGVFRKKRKVHARAGPELTALFSRIKEEEEEEKKERIAKQTPSTHHRSTTQHTNHIYKVYTPSTGAPRKPLIPQAKHAHAMNAVLLTNAKVVKKKLQSTAAAANPHQRNESEKEIDVDALQISQRASTNKLGLLTIPQLKAYCRSVKLAVGGKKIDLENRIKNHLGIATDSDNEPQGKKGE